MVAYTKDILEVNTASILPSPEYQRFQIQIVQVQTIGGLPHRMAAKIVKRRTKECHASNQVIIPLSKVQKQESTD